MTRLPEIEAKLTVSEEDASTLALALVLALTEALRQAQDADTIKATEKPPGMEPTDCDKCAMNAKYEDCDVCQGGAALPPAPDCWQRLESWATMQDFQRTAPDCLRDDHAAIAGLREQVGKLNAALGVSAWVRDEIDEARRRVDNLTGDFYAHLHKSSTPPPVDWENVRAELLVVQTSRGWRFVLPKEKEEEDGSATPTE